MPILKPNAATRHAVASVDVRLSRTLWQWLALGALAVLLLPPARGESLLLGALPFWLLVVPAIGLVTLHRHVLAAAWRARLVRATPRRRRRVAAVRATRPVRGALTTVRAGVVPQRHAR